jgi:solute:Na+ symporter, SSS family
MVYLSMWLRRSNATTGAEWIATRFGTGKGSIMSHNIVVVYALISCLGFLAYGFIGLGKVHDDLYSLGVYFIPDTF